MLIVRAVVYTANILGKSWWKRWLQDLYWLMPSTNHPTRPSPMIPIVLKITDCEVGAKKCLQNGILRNIINLISCSEDTKRRFFLQQLWTICALVCLLKTPRVTFPEEPRLTEAPRLKFLEGFSCPCNKYIPIGTIIGPSPSEINVPGGTTSWPWFLWWKADQGLIVVTQLMILKAF